MVSEEMRALIKRDGTNISWAHFTWNPWVGCEKVSPACDHCYAEIVGRNRLNVAWGPGAERRRTTPANWAKPLRWQRIAAAAGVALRVFCASLADWADNAVDPQWRLDLADVIRATPNLQWMLLTKRVGNAEAMLRAMFPEGVPPNVWLGITICNQEEADRDVPRALLVKTRLRLSKLFLSVEPMLGPIDLAKIVLRRDGQHPSQLSQMLGDYVLPLRGSFTDSPTVDLVICGGESGAGARPMHPAWPLVLGDQCRTSGTAFHFKQWGEWWWTQMGPLVRASDQAGKPSVIDSVTVDDRTYKGDRLHQFEDGITMIRVGVAKAGRRLHGVEYLEEMA